MNTSSLPITFAGSTLGRYRHICVFFSSPQEEYATLLPFVRDGIERGERAYHVLPARTDKSIRFLPRNTSLKRSGAMK